MLFINCNTEIFSIVAYDFQDGLGKLFYVVEWQSMTDSFVIVCEFGQSTIVECQAIIECEFGGVRL